MENTHDKEIGQLASLFKDQGLDRIDERMAVMRVFLSTEEHLSAERLAELLKESGYDFPPEFVRDNLRLLCRYGFANKCNFDECETVYEHRHLGEHHDHIICAKCGKITEFENHQIEALQAQIAKTLGFHMLGHRLELHGICPDCLGKRHARLSLAMLRPGERAAIREIAGGSGARLRLMSMGLKEGDKVEAIANNGGGQVVVACGGARMALGRGLAEKVLVEPLNCG
jgi:Fur family ferric uptake transcriptional regulator